MNNGRLMFLGRMIHQPFFQLFHTFNFIGFRPLIAPDPAMNLSANKPSRLADLSKARFFIVQSM